MEIRPHVLDRVVEATIDPARPIIDPHHHLFESTEGFPRYTLEDLWQDTSTHHVVQTVFMQCGEHYRESGPDHLAPVGETEWVAAVAARSAAGPADAARIAGIIGTAELVLGDRVQDVLEAHLEASSLFRGIRDNAVWDESEEVYSGSPTGDAFLYDDPRFRRGFAKLAPLGLSYDSYHYHTQTPSLIRLARDFPETTIVADHLSTPLGVGPYAGRRAEIFEIWRRDMSELARCPNVFVKLGGLAMPWNGFGWDVADHPPTSDEIVTAQGHYYRHAIDAFGAERCMFESNFPVDKVSVSYNVLWNAFKKIAAGASESEKDCLFRDTAMRVYRLDPGPGGR
jgi:predicted TIM-barrel fold metal-dependent hydrolase